MHFSHGAAYGLIMLSFKAHFLPQTLTFHLLVTIDSAATDPDNATREWFMEGLLVQARLANCQSPTPIGTFMVPDCDNFLQVIDCSGVKMVRSFCFLNNHRIDLN